MNSAAFMPTDKEIKALLKKETQKNPDKYYATSFLKKKNFYRKKTQKNKN